MAVAGRFAGGYVAADDHLRDKPLRQFVGQVEAQHVGRLGATEVAAVQRSHFAGGNCRHVDLRQADALLPGEVFGKLDDPLAGNANRPLCGRDRNCRADAFGGHEPQDIGRAVRWQRPAGEAGETRGVSLSPLRRGTTILWTVTSDPSQSRWSLPFSMPQSADPRRRSTERLLRIAAYALLAVIFLAVAVQFQHGTVKRLNDGSATTKGAMARWRGAFRDFWAGEDIYDTKLHPNMPFTVIVLSPLAYLPPSAMAATLSALKLATLAVSILMAARIAGHGRGRTCDWVIGLALLWSMQMLISDIQHGNTNIFVLGLIVLHLWLFRRGQDIPAGAALAAAICLKMTPALFVLYWLYQRNWKLLGATVVAGLVFAVGVPVVAVGPSRYMTLMGSWLNKLIIPGLVKGAWYPIHINQSLPGVMSRYFLAGPNGDAFWNPDDFRYGDHGCGGWITLAALPETVVKAMVRCGQVLVVAAMAWGIGWRKLPRDDGRRMLHYGMITLGMMILNQRTWQHHAVVLLIAVVAIWQAIAFGRMQRRARRWALGLMIAAGPLLWLNASDLYKVLAKVMGQSSKVGERWADYVDAYGPTFWFFMLLLGTSVLLARSMRQVEPPYAPQRQTLRDELT